MTPLLYYDICMPVRLTDDQLATYVAEAKDGYDVDRLITRDRGYPGQGIRPTHVVTVHLTAAELAALDQLADRLHMNRSAAIRYAITHHNPRHEVYPLGD